MDVRATGLIVLASVLWMPEGQAGQDYPTAVTEIRGVLVGRLNLPMPEVVLESCATREIFEATLVRQLKLKPASAATAAKFAKAIVGNNKIIISEQAMAEYDWPRRVLTMAHEMVHLSQLDLAERRRSLVRYQWLTEGFAEHVGYEVVVALGRDDMGRVRADQIARVREVRRRGLLPRLAEVDSMDQWIASRDQRGFDAAYPFAFLVIEVLEERHSRQAVLDYFRRFASSADPAANFRSAFGESLESFQQALDRRFASLLE